MQTRLQTYARAVSTAGPVDSGLPIWNWGYLGVFLAEYYLATGDANVLPGINQYSLKLAQTQSMFGTFGHGPAIVRPDGTGRMSVAGYGPVNAAGLPANLALVMGRKALLAATQPVDPQIDAAIQRASDFFSWYVNKGSIPYGEHHPGADDHGSNGKDQTAALFFSQQDNRLAETEYFTRMSVAGFTGREYGHTGQGFSYLWEGMATHVGGPLAVAEYFKPVRWHLDLSRRTDGSFAYDGGEQYDAGKTSDGTYLGASGYNDLNPTACYLLTYSLPLKRLYITGKNANPAHELDSTKVANAIAAATYKFDRTSRTTTQLIGDLSEFDPVVRNYAAKELATRTLTSTELTTLRTMLSGTNANGRMGACQTLGLRQGRHRHDHDHPAARQNRRAGSLGARHRRQRAARLRHRRQLPGQHDAHEVRGQRGRSRHDCLERPSSGEQRQVVVGAFRQCARDKRFRLRRHRDHRREEPALSSRQHRVQAARFGRAPESGQLCL